MGLLEFVECLLILTLAKAQDTSYQCNLYSPYKYDASVKGEITSPFFHERDRYYNDLWCEYKITAPEGYRIKITFKEMDIDCNGDELVLYGKMKQTLLGEFCGTNLPYPVFSNPGENEIRMLFKSGPMVTGKGFRLEYESSPNMQVCNAGFTQCRNRNCYDNHKQCDGHDDCGDGTDEENCNFPIVIEPKHCGKPVITPNTIYSKDGKDRLVGGEAAIPNSWPWMVSLQRAGTEKYGHFCGGTLINAQWVLTATHCILPKSGIMDPSSVKIKLGSHYKFKRSKYEQTRIAVKIIAYAYPDSELVDVRNYDNQNEITLIKLNAPVEFNDGVSPACLPQLGWGPKPGWICYAIGWGATRGSGAADELKQMEQIVQPVGNCSFNEQAQICVAKPWNSICHGDSGSPLQCMLEGRWYVFGAASSVTTSNKLHGLCVGHDAKGIYTSTSNKAQWIRNIINKYS